MLTNHYCRGLVLTAMLIGLANHAEATSLFTITPGSIGTVAEPTTVSITVDTFLGSFSGVASDNTNRSASIGGSLEADVSPDLTSIDLTTMNLLINPLFADSVGGQVSGSFEYQTVFGLAEPMTSPLVATGQPGEFLVGGSATLAMSLLMTDLTISIPSISIFSDPFSLGPLLFPTGFTPNELVVGTFSGDAFGTALEIDFDLPDSGSLSAAPQVITTGLPAGINSVTISPTLIRFAGASNVQVSASSTTPIPEPSTALLLGFGLSAVSVVRRVKGLPG